MCVCTTLLIGKAEMISINQSIREKLKTLPLYFFWNLNRSSHWEEPIQSKAPNDIILLIIQMCWSIHQTPPSATVTIDRTIGFLQFIVILLFLFLFCFLENYPYVIMVFGLKAVMFGLRGRMVGDCVCSVKDGLSPLGQSEWKPLNLSFISGSLGVYRVSSVN